MKSIEVYDPAMCCSSGACGPAPDQSLAAFASALEKVKASGVSVKRYNLAQEPLAFADKPEVKSVLEKQGEAGLPLLFIDGDLYFRGVYPSAEQLSKAVGVVAGEAESCCGAGDDRSSGSKRKEAAAYLKVDSPDAASSSCCDSSTGCC